MSEQFVPEAFDDWAANYDHSVYDGSGFPFDGYREVLKTILDRAPFQPGDSVFDLGTGTGNLAVLFAARGCELWCLDFSAEMLALARKKLPNAHFCQADIRGEWQADFQRRCHGIVSAYTFHHFLLEEKVALVQRLLRDHLLPGGSLIIGDIAFASAAARDEVRHTHAEEWDEEYYWLADEALEALAAVGIEASFIPVSYCAGVFKISLPE